MTGLADCRTAAEVIANYKAVRARMRALKPPPEPEPYHEPPRPALTLVGLREAATTEPDPFYVPDVALQRPMIRDIQNGVCRYYNVSRTELLSGRRTKHIAHVRQVAMYLCKTLTLHSLPEIGRRFGNRDHTTILWGVRKIESLRATDAALAKELEDIQTSAIRARSLDPTATRRPDVPAGVAESEGAGGRGPIE